MLDINKAFSELAQYKAVYNDAKTMIDSIQDDIKSYMKECNIEVLQGTEHRATYKAVMSNRFDSSAFKSDKPDLYKAYTKASKTNRFTFN